MTVGKKKNPKHDKELKNFDIETTVWLWSSLHQGETWKEEHLEKEVEFRKVFQFV